MKQTGVRISRGLVAGRLAGKVVLITGAASGQGRAVSLLFARAGARVAASDIDASGLDETARLAETENLHVHTRQVDATDPEGVVRWVGEVASREGGIDILYNNGAGVRMAPFAEMSLESWHETLRLELDVVFLPTRAAWPHMIARGSGSIINIASTSGMRGLEYIGATAHAAGKGGVIAMTRQLALEGAPHAIRVNSIAPGPIRTPATAGRLASNEAWRDVFNGWPLLARTGVPEDVAYLGLFLASDESDFITGVNIPVDGGATAKSGRTDHA